MISAAGCFVVTHDPDAGKVVELYNKMIPEPVEHILSFLSPDSLLPPTLLELSKLLKRPTLDLVVLHREVASPHVCSYEGFV